MVPTEVISAPRRTTRSPPRTVGLEADLLARYTANFSEPAKVARAEPICLGSGGLAVRTTVAVSGFKASRDGGIVRGGAACAPQTAAVVSVTGRVTKTGERRAKRTVCGCAVAERGAATTCETNADAICGGGRVIVTRAGRRTRVGTTKARAGGVLVRTASISATTLCGGTVDRVFRGALGCRTERRGRRTVAVATSRC